MFDCAKVGEEGSGERCSRKDVGLDIAPVGVENDALGASVVGDEAECGGRSDGRGADDDDQGEIASVDSVEEVHEARVGRDPREVDPVFEGGFQTRAGGNDDLEALQWEYYAVDLGEVLLGASSEEGPQTSQL